MSKTFALQSRDYLDTPDRKRYYNEQLFTEVAPRYDAITRLLSFGRDAAWKRAMIAAIPAHTPRRCADLACGTGDLAVMVKRRFPDAVVTGLDLTPAMVELARTRNAAERVGFDVGDMAALPFENSSIDLVTGGYALRNAPDLEVALAEVARVLRPCGYAAFLDFSKSPHRWSQQLACRLLKGWGGLWGLALHRHADVYGYIAESLARYPDRVRIRRMLSAHGLDVVASRACFGGMVEWIVCHRARG